MTTAYRLVISPDVEPQPTNKTLTLGDTVVGPLTQAFVLHILWRHRLIAYVRLQPILISRFLINLREAHQPEGSTSAGHFSRFSAPNFRVPTIASIVGDMGEPLAHGLRGGDQDEGLHSDDMPLDMMSPAASQQHSIGTSGSYKRFAG